MAKRAVEPNTDENEVFELNNDARWQARLDEARGRRMAALKEKGLVDRPTRAPRKPWEEPVETAADLKIRQRSLDDTGLDFHDRMNALHKVLKSGPKAEPPRGANWSEGAETLDDVTPVEKAPKTEEPVATPKAPRVEPSSPPVDTFFDELPLTEPDAASDIPVVETPDVIPVSELLQPAAPREDLSVARPWLKAAEDDVRARDAAMAEPDQGKPEVAPKSKETKRGMPFFLGTGLVALMAMPFFTLLPPMLRGPDAAPSPAFAFQPALGITAAMAEFPVATQSGEFVPASDVAPGGPLLVALPRPPVFSRVMPDIAASPAVGIFEMPALGALADPVVETGEVRSLPQIKVVLPAIASEVVVQAEEVVPVPVVTGINTTPTLDTVPPARL